MNRFLRGASFAAALIISASTLFGCGKDFSEELTLINQLSDTVMSVEAGEILINETVTLEKDITGVEESRAIETYVRFSNGPESPDFELEKNEWITATGENTVYTFVKSGETMFELFDGVGGYAEEAPDIYETLRIDFDAEDITDLEVSNAEKGNDCYKLTMTGDYANKFDKESDGVKFDCTNVVICYYIDSLGNFTKRTCEITTALTADGETQTMTQFIEAKIK